MSKMKRILAAVLLTDWNRREAARRLDVDESTVRRRMRKHGLTESQLS